MEAILHLSLFTFFPILILLSPPASAQLRQNYYADICPDVEAVVRAAVSQKLQQSFITAPGTLRLFFHDCFVRGCDASVMLVSASLNDERHHHDDLSLAGDAFDTVVKAKAAVDADPRCTYKVSCADILTIAARDVVSLTGGPYYQVELGRLDGKISTKASVQHSLPHPEFNLDELNAMFQKHGLTQTDMIALSGAHTIGFSHCEKFRRRIYNFRRWAPVDPTMDKDYAEHLRQACPEDVNPSVAVPIDPTSPFTFDNAFYQNLLSGKGLLTSDQVLFTDARSRDTVQYLAWNRTAFEEAFVVAMTKLGRVGVKTGSDGEVRRDCSFVNS